MQFVHISDNHLGYRQYNLDEREKDIYNAFNMCIDEIIDIKPDFVIHSGDLFEQSTPPINALYTAIKAFEKLKECNIPVYIIHGNHDVPSRITKGSPYLILKNMLKDKLRTFTGKKYHIFKKNNKEIFIGGSDYASIGKTTELFDDYKLIEQESKNYKNKILIFHQSIYSYSDIPTYELQVNNLPRGFNYYAGGHIHKRILKTVDLQSKENNNNKNNNPDNNGSQVLGWSGSTEITDYDEYRDYKKEGKGFYLVDISKNDFDISCVDKINIKCRDFIIDKEIKNENDFENLVNELNNYNDTTKPIVICGVARELLGSLRELMNKKALYSRLSIIEEDIDTASMFLDINNKTDEMFREFLRNKKYDVEFVQGLYYEALKGDNELYDYINNYYIK
ncbi:DNA repair exonuclease [Methanococcus aeolicus]|uniref:DNA repair exonuclease n=1 Tax=Methanococcus aeolicus TaxID=42879 RepID=UPI0021C91ACC|nr:DNA repair exonuclease [Methanococcus aeolicus]UXM84305.1 DNA repair exonuclease [Methanococcus aeolicus]